MSLSLKKPHCDQASNAPLKECTTYSKQHFSKPVSSPEHEKASKGVIPSNTEASTQWDVRNFIEWAVDCCSLVPDDPVTKDLMASRDTDLVCKWLCHFVMEIIMCHMIQAYYDASAYYEHREYISKNQDS